MRRAPCFELDVLGCLSQVSQQRACRRNVCVACAVYRKIEGLDWLKGLLKHMYLRIRGYVRVYGLEKGT